MAKKSAKSGGASPAKGSAKSTKPKATTARSKAKAPKAPKSSARKSAAPAPWDDAPEPAAGGRKRSLVIVESPSKARSIAKYLGSSYVVKASMGHVRDLPEKGGGLAIDVANKYEPTYEILSGKESTIADLRREAQKATMTYLATDPDREGEAIAWHLQQALGLDEERSQRVMFHEITERAVKEAFDHTGPIDMNKVNAQQARRFLDRFVGYQISPLLWRKVARTKPSLSAGRVQSVALRLIVEREKEIEAFQKEEYWKITATVRPEGLTAEDAAFTAELSQWKGAKFSASNETDAKAIYEQLRNTPYRVAGVEESEKLDRPDAPFKTSTLQQQASIRLRLQGSRTMKIAQELYEGIDVDGSGPTGLITYMRTDSLRVSDEAITAVRQTITERYGDRYLPAKPNRYSAGKNAQEAHEAIRPTNLALEPDRIRDRLSADQYKLYNLIYRRFVASQMNPAVFAITDVEIAASEGVFKTQGKILKFDGYRKVLPPGGKQEDALLPNLSAGQALDLLELVPTQHFTQPPPRYSEATLIKALEKENIGRPSTYAEIIRTVQYRRYVDLEERKFKPTVLGMVVTDQLVKHFPKIMDVKFTAHMEDELDGIAQAKTEMTQVLDEFYHPFQEDLGQAANEKWGATLSDQTCPKCEAPMVVKFNKAGNPFHSCSRYPDCDGVRRITGEVGEADAPEVTDFKCAKCERPLLKRTNQRGSYFACSGYPTCKATYKIGDDGAPIVPVVVGDHKCPKCGSEMLRREGPRGPFLGCSAYPKCRSTMPLDAEGKPIEPVKVDVPCPKCGGPMGLKQGRRGGFLGCLKYPKCRGTSPLPEDMKDAVPAAAARPSASADLKAIQVAQTCDQCGSAMIVRRGKRGFFLGCSKYPKCRGTKEPDADTLAKIEAVTSQATAESSEPAE